MIELPSKCRVARTAIKLPCSYNCHRLGEGFMVWGRAKGLELGLAMAVLAARQFDGSSSCTSVRWQFYGAFTMDNRVPTCSIIHVFTITRVCMYRVIMSKVNTGLTLKSFAKHEGFSMFPVVY